MNLVAYIDKAASVPKFPQNNSRWLTLIEKAENVTVDGRMIFMAVDTHTTLRLVIFFQICPINRIPELSQYLHLQAQAARPEWTLKMKD
jgi:hypothetical protein